MDLELLASTTVKSKSAEAYTWRIKANRSAHVSNSNRIFEHQKISVSNLYI